MVTRIVPTKPKIHLNPQPDHFRLGYGLHPNRFRTQATGSRHRQPEPKRQWQIMLTLIKLAEMPPPGEQPGVFSKVYIDKGKDEDGIDFENLVLVVDLDRADSTGKKFQLERTYNVKLKRGVTAFRNDFYIWSGRKLTDYDLATFEPEKWMTGKPVKLVVRHRKDGKKSVAVIDQFKRTVIEPAKDAEAANPTTSPAPAQEPAATQGGNHSESSN